MRKVKLVIVANFSYLIRQCAKMAMSDLICFYFRGMRHWEI